MQFHWFEQTAGWRLEGETEEIVRPCGERLRVQGLVAAWWGGGQSGHLFKIPCNFIVSKTRLDKCLREVMRN